jgi:DNA-directed RNA polymerase specialized sigma subunit
MSGFESEFELDDKMRKVIASDIAGLDEEAFSAYKEKISAFLQVKKEEVVEAKTEEVVASAEEIVEEVTEKAEKEVVDVPMTSTASEETIYQKYKTAFDYDGFVVS